MKTSFSLFILSLALMLLAAPPAYAEIDRLKVRTALHQLTTEGAVTRWTSTFKTYSASFEAVKWRLQFAQPLSADSSISSADGVPVEVIRDHSGRIVGVDFLQMPNKTTALDIAVPAELADPPLVAEVPQAVEFAGLRVRPDPGSPLQLRLTSIRHRGLTDLQAEKLEAEWRVWLEESGRPVYVLPDSEYFDSGQISAHVELPEELRVRNFAVLLAVFLLVLGLLLVALRVIARRARAEEAEEFLRTFDLTEEAT